jgi:membrane fusion protein (multidrug efflux system)
MSDSKTPNKKKRSLLRRVLMLGGVAIVLIGGTGFYLLSGRYIETENAYVKADKIMVAPEVGGVVVGVNVANNQPVTKGSVLFSIDPAQYRIAEAKAQADLMSARSKIEEKKAEYRQKLQDVERAQVEVDYFTKEYDRQIELRAKDTVSQSKIDDIKRQRDAARKQVLVLREDAEQIKAALMGNPDIHPEDHPVVQAAAAAVDKAQLDLQHTTVLAPVNGIVGSVPNAGDYAHASVPMINLVSTGSSWIDANYKETELTNVRIGQPVDVTIDTYPGVHWKGVVSSISPATGAEFSILPAQNTTGNWVKVVQRITVRIDFMEGPEDLPKRAGMSTIVSIDTGSYPHMPKAWAK